MFCTTGWINDFLQSYVAIIMPQVSISQSSDTINFYFDPFLLCHTFVSFLSYFIFI